MSHPAPAAEAPSAKRAKVDDGANGTAVMAASSMSSYGVSKPFVVPSDWPPPGPIDLATADLPHDSADTEWWYINAHVNDKETGHELSLFASFFRICKQINKDGSLEHAHALSWAIVDVANKKFYCDPILDRSTPEILRRQLGDGTYDLDERMRRAFIEVVNKENVPLPDRMFDGPVVVSKTSCDLQYAENFFRKDPATGHYHVHCECKEKGIAFTVDLGPQKPPTRQGGDGFTRIGLKQDTMFYYYIPRNTCVGTIELPGKKFNVEGSGWYDHEFGGEIKPSKRRDLPESKGEEVVVAEPEQKSKATYAWNWFSCQLSDGSDITATSLYDVNINKEEDSFAIITGPAPEGKRTEYRNIQFESLREWVSIRTTNHYPTKYRLRVPEADMDIEIEAVFDDQELITLISKPAFWEGRMNITGKMYGKPITGKGFVERHGWTSMASLDGFFKRISKQVMEQIDMVMPLNPSYEQTRELLCSTEFDHFMDGVSIDVFKKTIIHPLREIIDRGGKSWRSFAFLLCIDAVGGYSHKYKHWLAMPEMMHVGSLIVDDIQDKSPIRRGGPSCHVVHGDAVAINAGTAAYFLSLHILQSLTPDLDVATRCRLYEIYFLTLRAGHSGQAFDIYGLDYLMDEAVQSGDSEKLEKSVACTHRLKSANPAGCLARMGALVGGGSTKQIDVLGLYMESIGLAFQIMDDVLNLRGFEGNTKDLGEDIKAGKVTYPVAKAMSRARIADAAERQKLWSVIKSKPQDNAVVGEVIAKLTSCGALQASVDEANRLVADAWADVDAHIPDSFFKMLLRAFGWYVLERHY